MLNNKSFLASSTFIFIASALANFANFLFQIIMNAMLTPEEFGALISLLALLIVVSVPISSTQTVITKFTAGFKATDDIGSIASLYRYMLKRLGLVGLGSFFAMILISEQIRLFLKIDSVMPVLMLAGVIVASLLQTVTFGILQGLQRFRRYGVTLIGDSYLRLLFAVVFVYLGFSVAGALGASIASVFLVLGLTAWHLRYLNYYEGTSEGLKVLDIYKYFGPVFSATLCMTLLLSLDVLLVKHFMTETVAGTYATIVTAGKVIFFLPSAITVVMFPKVAEVYAVGRDTKAMLIKSMAICLTLTLSATIIYAFFPQLVTMVLFQGRYSEIAPYLGLEAVAMTALAMVHMLVYYQLSIHSYRFIKTLGVFAAIEFLAISFFHNNIASIIATITVIGITLFAINIWLATRKTKTSSMQE